MRRCHQVPGFELSAPVYRATTVTAPDSPETPEVSSELAAAGHGRVSPEFARLTDMASDVVDRDQPQSTSGVVHRDQWSWAAVHRRRLGAVVGFAAGRG